MHAVDGFTGEEIAQILGLSVGTVWTRLHRARKQLITRQQTLMAQSENPGGQVLSFLRDP
jgi:DNA-directed RNA polymerase specialized sigma24 family protein